MVREFYLLNNKGQKFSLMDIQNACLFTTPSGLGYGYTTEYSQIGNVFNENKKNINQNVITGTVNFINYDNYRKLIDFIENAESLRLLYCVPYNDTVVNYYRDVFVNSLSKTEMQVNNVMSEEISFECLSLWYKKINDTYEISNATDIIRWDFKWDSRFESNTSNGIDFINDGHTDSTILLSIEGEAVNPKIEVFVEGKIYQSIRFNVNISEFERLMYSSKENDFYIKKQNVDGTFENLFNLDVIDFNNDNIIRLPKNKDIQIVLSATNRIKAAEITIFTYYKVV